MPDTRTQTRASDSEVRTVHQYLEAMTARGYRTVDIATAAGLSPSFVTGIKKGRSRPSQESCHAILTQANEYRVKQARAARLKFDRFHGKP